jgi:hypothetical protein
MPIKGNITINEVVMEVVDLPQVKVCSIDGEIRRWYVRVNPIMKKRAVNSIFY